MSDISASDAGSEASTGSEAVSEGVEATEAFDLDAAVDEFASSAPDEWKTKAGKIQSELKNLRASRNELRDKFNAFDGLHASDLQAVTGLVTAIKSGDTEAAAEWMVNAAKGLTGDQFEEKFGFTKAEAQEAIEAAETTEEPELSVEERIQKALDDRDKAHREQVEAQERQANINAKFSELGLNTERNEQGHLVDTKAQMVAQFAIREGGDIDKGFEAFNKWLGDAAKEFVQTKGDPTLTTEGGESAGSVAPDTSNMTPAQRAQARINGLFGGPQA